MAALWLLVLVLPALANGETFALGGCGRLEGQTDKLARTQEGRQLVTEVMAKTPSMYLWDPSNTEKGNKAITANIDLSGGTAEFKFAGSDGTPLTYGATAEWMDVADPMETYVKLVFNSPSGTTFLEHFGADKDNESHLHPTYISKHEIIFTACTNVFFGRIFTVYVFTTTDLSSFSDKSCPISVVKDSTSMTMVDPDATA